MAAMKTAVGRGALVVLAAMLAVANLAIPVASANDHENPFDGSDSPTVIVWDLDNKVVIDFAPTSGAVEVTVVADPVCAEWTTDVISEEPYLTSTYCSAHYACYAERIDDVLTGIAAGTGETDGYREYRDSIQGTIESIFAVLPFVGDVPSITPGTITTALIELELGDPSSLMALPVFYYCRVGEGGELVRSDLTYPEFEPAFGWTTTIADEYDIPGRRLIVIDRLIDELNFHVPDLRAIPPLDGEFTYVQFPTWFWLEDPVEVDGLWAESVGGTIRLSARATLDYVLWEFGDGRDPLKCTIDQMESYVGGDPADAPHCHKVFQELDSYSLTATAYYDIEEQISYKLARADSYPDAPWVTHPTQPVITVTGDAGVIDVHQLVALNVYNGGG